MAPANINMNSETLAAQKVTHSAPVARSSQDVTVDNALAMSSKKVFTARSLGGHRRGDLFARLAASLDPGTAPSE